MMIQSAPSRPVPSATPNLAAVLAMALSAALLAILLSATLDLPTRFSGETDVETPTMQGVPVTARPLSHTGAGKYRIGRPQCRNGTVTGADAAERLICL